MRRTNRLLITFLAALVAVALGACARGTPSAAPSELLARASALLDANDAAAAVPLLEQALAQEDSAAARYLLGNAWSQQGRYDQAEPAYLRALELDPAHDDARANLAVAYYMQGRNAEAEETTRQVLARHLQDADLHYNLGAILAAKQRYDEAEASFLAAQSLNDTLPQVYLGLGVLYRDTGRNEEAVGALQRYLELSSDAEWRAEAETILKELGVANGS